MRDLIPLFHSGGASAPAERRDAAANRQRILEAARRLFAERGVDVVTMEQVAQAAGVGKGTLYRRFADKGQLCLALLDDELARFQNAMLAQLRDMTAAQMPQLEQLAWFFDALVGFHDEYMELLYEARSEGEQRLSDKVHTLDWQRVTVEMLLRAAVDAGEVAPTLDIAYITAALLAPLSGPMFRYHRAVRGFSPEQISAGLRGLVLGLRYHAGGRPL